MLEFDVYQISYLTSILNRKVKLTIKVCGGMLNYQHLGILMRACVHACVRACMRACDCVCMCVCEGKFFLCKSVFTVLYDCYKILEKLYSLFNTKASDNWNPDKVSHLKINKKLLCSPNLILLWFIGEMCLGQPHICSIHDNWV